MFHTECELPERIKRLLFRKKGRCPMDTFSPKCLFCLAANILSLRMERKTFVNQMGRKCLISRPFNQEVCWIQTYCIMAYLLLPESKYYYEKKKKKRKSLYLWLLEITKVRISSRIIYSRQKPSILGHNRIFPADRIWNTL